MTNPVSVFVCGVQKGGTTSLYAYFRKHPELSPPTRKEVHYFSNEEIMWSSPNYQKYEAFYAKGDEGKLRFDITPIYAFWPPAMRRMARYNPNAKLIFLFRDPFDRAFSQWCMEYSRGEEKLPFEKAIRSGRKRFDGLTETAPEWRIFSYIERGFYAQQLRRAMEHFPLENMLFLRSSDLLKNYQETLNAIANFLRIKPFPDLGLVREHKRPKIDFPSGQTEEDRMFISMSVRDEMLEFAKITGLDISDWPVVREV